MRRGKNPGLGDIELQLRRCSDLMGKQSISRPIIGRLIIETQQAPRRESPVGRRRIRCGEPEDGQPGPHGVRRRSRLKEVNDM